MYTHVSLGQDKVLRAGDIIKLHDQEKGGLLSATMMIFLQQSDNKPGLLNSLAHTAAEEATMTGFLNHGRDNDGGIKQEAMSFWQIMLFGEPTRGDVLAFETQKVVLRHLASGKYLAVRKKEASKQALGWAPGSDDGHFMCYFSDEATDPNAAFRISAVSQVSTLISSGAYCRLQHLLTQSYFHTSQSTLHALDVHTFVQCQSKQDIDDDLFDEKLNINFRSKFTFEDVFEITRVDEDDVDDFNVVFSLRPQLQLVVEATSWEVSKCLPSQAHRQQTDVTGGFGFEGTESLSAWDKSGKRLITAGYGARTRVSMLVCVCVCVCVRG